MCMFKANPRNACVSVFLIYSFPNPTCVELVDPIFRAPSKAVSDTACIRIMKQLESHEVCILFVIILGSFIYIVCYELNLRYNIS